MRNRSKPYDLYGSDPLDRYRTFARQALDDPELDLDDGIPHTGDEPWLDAEDKSWLASSDFDPEVAISIAITVRFLASIRPHDQDDAVRSVLIDEVVDFLTTSESTLNAPLIETDAGQVIRFRRGANGRTRSVWVTRSDAGAMSSADLRFPYRKANDLDAETRISASFVDRFNLESDVPGVVDRARRRLRQTEAPDSLRGNARLRRVAQLYNEGVEAGYGSSRRRIMEELDVGYNYAGQLVKRARDKGFLPPIDNKGGDDA